MNEPTLKCNSGRGGFDRVPFVVDHRVANQVRLLRCPDLTSNTSQRRHSLKRVFDFLTAMLIILYTSPVFVILIILVALQNDGPVFYAQQRIGRGGVVFHCFKFRTMCKGADRVLASLLASDDQLMAEWVTTGKLRNDPRVSRVGRFLRATSLDELPQLWNVLRGDMSLVGPRPITETELKGPYTMYNGLDAYLSVRPGITGLWQVSGRSAISYEGRVALDVTYVETSSAFKDLQILFRTFRAVIWREGAC